MTRIPGGCQTYSKAPDRFGPGAPVFTDYANGPYVYDAAGTRWLDCVAGLGPVILGHHDAEVDSAVVTQIARGICFPTATALEGELADLIASLVPGAEMCRYGKNGADVTAAAVRLARAVTKRSHVVSIGYHGFHDWSMAYRNPLGIPHAARALLTEVSYGDLPALEQALTTRQAACLIMEPVVATEPLLPPPGYLAACRDLCDRTGTLLIYDEIVTGFRCALGGAQEAWAAPMPDLTCLGKAMGNGYPISALVGKAEYMTRLQSGGVFFSTTFGGDAVGLAAGLATLTKLRDCGVPATLAARGTQLMAAMGEAIRAADLEAVVSVIGYPARPVLRWLDPAARQRFDASLVRQGVLQQGYLNLMLAHSEAILETLVRAITFALGDARAEARAA